MALMFPRVARNFAKNGYYPTDEQTLERILAMLKPDDKGITNVIDPCAGEGVAIAEVKHCLGKDSTMAFAVEYDQERALHAATITDHCLRSDLMDSVISRQSFGLLWLNPPYGDLASDTAGVTAYQGTGRKRLEKLFYQRTMPLLQYDGVMVLILPGYVLDEEFAGWITNHFRDLCVYEGVDKTFKQVVIIGKRTRSAETSKDKERKPFRDQLIRIGRAEAQADELPPLGDAVASYPVPHANKDVDQFFRISMDPEQMLEEIQRAQGCWSDFAGIFYGTDNQVQRQPARPLSDWHLALSLAAGALSGVIHSPRSGRTLIVKGDTHKKKVRRIEFTENEHGDVAETKIDTDVFVPLIKAWEMTPNSDLFGSILHISGGSASNEEKDEQPAGAAKFDLGQVVMTPGVEHIATRGFLNIHELLERHVSGDWGDISSEDWKLNQVSLNPEPDQDGQLHYGRLFSSYDVDDTFSGEARVWIITEWDRSYTTILLPSEY